MSLDEISAALMVTFDDLMTTLSKEVTCVGCRRSVETLVHQVSASENFFSSLPTRWETKLVFGLGKPLQFGQIIVGRLLHASVIFLGSVRRVW
jgi:hypothetical protein